MQPDHGHSQSKNMRWPLGIGAVMALLYLLTRSNRYDPEVLIELRILNHLQMTSDPAHPFFVWSSLPIVRLWKAWGYSGDALLPTQILNALWGAGALALFFVLLHRLVHDRPLALLTTLGAGLSYAYWTHTVDSFFIAPAIFFSVGALLFAVMLGEDKPRSRRRSAWLAFGLGAAWGLAILSYQVSLALLPALAFASWPRTRFAPKSWLVWWLISGAVALLVAAPMLVWQATDTLGLHSPRQIVDWYFFSHGGMSEGLWRRDGGPLWRTLPTAWVATIIPLYEGIRLRALLQGQFVLDRLPAQVALLLLLTMILLLALLSVTLIRRRNARPPLLWTLTLVSLWFGGQGALVAWFDPAEVKLWIIPMLGLWLMACVVIANARSEGIGGRAGGQWPGILLGLFVVATAVGNLLTPVWLNHSQPSIEMEAAQVARTHLRRGDLLLSASFDWTLHAGYLADLHNDGSNVVNLIGIAQQRGRDAVLPTLTDTLLKTWQSGGRVFVVDYFSPGKEAVWQSWITPYTHITAADLVQYGRHVAWEFNSEPIWELTESHE